MYVNANYERAGLAWLLGQGYERIETELFKELVTEGMTVVDVGANIGYYSLIAARLVGNTGKVYAFEPEPGNYQLLVRNIEANGYTNIVPVNIAISNEGGKVKLYVDPASSSTHSFAQDNTNIKGDAIEVETVTLDDFFGGEKVDFIKLDAQGAEGLVLDGATGVLKQDKLKIMMEFWPDGLDRLGTEPLDLLHKLQEMEFQIKEIDKTTRIVPPEQVLEKVELQKKEAGGIGLFFHINLLLEKG
jgi:FkbM family methyltransferase